MDPYCTTNIVSWFGILFSRLVFGWGTELYLDEIQTLVLSMIAISGAVLGTLLIEKHLVMVANALSHTMVLGVVLSYVIADTYGILHEDHPPYWLMQSLVVMVAWLSLYIMDRFTSFYGVHADASNGMTLSLFFSMSLVIWYLWNPHGHACFEMFLGDPEALTSADVFSAALHMAGCVIGIGIFSRSIYISAIDPAFAALAGIPPKKILRFVMVITACVLAGAFRCVGFIVTMAFFIFPPLCAKLWLHTIHRIYVCGAFIGVLAVLVSMALSRHLLTEYGMPSSISALTAVVLGMIYSVAWSIHKIDTHYFRASIPGRVPFSINSRAAPPPVDM